MSASASSATAASSTHFAADVRSRPAIGAAEGGRSQSGVTREVRGIPNVHR
jgi:hypothetical protein